MIESSSDIWDSICDLNNHKYEFRLLGKDKDIPVLLAEDYFKEPDKIAEFLREGQWWTNGYNKDDNVIRPGKSLHFHPEMHTWFAEPLIQPLASVLGLKEVQIGQVYGNCFNGNMELSDIHSCFPHTDFTNFDPTVSDQIAFNINLTKSDNVMTGFYSFNNLKSRLDYSWNDNMAEEEFFFEMKNSLKEDATWFHIDHYGPYRLEETIEIGYNTIIAYPTHFLHAPYIKSDWFTDTDRLTLAGFINTSPEDLDFEQKHLDDVSYAWEFFHLDKIHNYHPKKTTPR
tara:strand:- start:1392 stop:2246 length:855 start_codon:yes stop_codon:yes gene_type:complete